MRKFVFLFFLIMLFLVAVAPDENNSAKKNKILSEELEFSKMLKKYGLNHNWALAEATYYDPLDSSQTKKNPDGIGAFNRKIESGSISFGNPLAKKFKREKLVVFIKIENFNIETPYGEGIFRVDDMLALEYRKDSTKYYIDFSKQDLNPHLQKIGNFQVRFKYLKIQKESDYF